MKLSSRLLSKAYHITLFTNPQCSLCDTAKAVLNKVQARRAFELKEINIHQPGQEHWRDQYGFDTPVIHVQTLAAAQQRETTTAAQKLMHRFTEVQIEDKLDNL